MGTYTAGEVVRVSAAFTTITGTPVDPSTVALTYSVAGAAAVTKTYALAEVTKDSVGNYHYDINTTAMSGTVLWEWVATGTGATAQAGSFQVTAYESFGFVRLDELCAYLRVSVDSADDPIFALAIEAATSGIKSAVNRTFEAQTAAQDRYFTAYRRPGLWPSYWGAIDWGAVYPSLLAATIPTPMLEVSDFFLTGQALGAITVTDTISLTTYTPTQTWPFNAAATGDPYTKLVFAAGTYLPLGEGQLKVNAKWGWVQVPDTIKNACLLQAARIVKRRDAPFGIAGADAMGNVMRLQAKLDPDVEVMVSTYRRWWAAA